jgi:hypothetical protein
MEAELEKMNCETPRLLAASANLIVPRALTSQVSFESSSPQGSLAIPARWMIASTLFNPSA